MDASSDHCAGIAATRQGEIAQGNALDSFRAEIRNPERARPLRSRSGNALKRKTYKKKDLSLRIFYDEHENGHI